MDTNDISCLFIIWIGFFLGLSFIFVAINYGLKIAIRYIISACIVYSLVLQFLFGSSPNTSVKALWHSTGAWAYCEIDKLQQDKTNDMKVLTTLLSTLKPPIKFIFGLSNDPCNEPLCAPTVLKKYSYSIIFDAEDELKKNLNFEILDVLEENEDHVKVEVNIINKSFWFLDFYISPGKDENAAQSDPGGTFSTTERLNLAPKSKTNAILIFYPNQSIFIRTTAGLMNNDTYNLNLVNFLSLAVVGEPFPDPKAVLKELVLEYGEDLTNRIEKDPEIVLQFLVSKGLLNPQTNLGQYVSIQTAAGILSKIFAAYTILEVIYNIPTTYYEAVSQWFYFYKGTMPSGYLKLIKQ
jgi:hypothetical protein